ncbi:hypothetical protein O9H85_01855 [Paenibacillus filicis]|uniref:Uncharacterized protein n=1 Tax=Paenibacillus gyeongsangnamensis TaxID=3388067 RepID=A0ABT4Q2Z8_9BACL|nr:hypothetical protein [Paenibacillus filicis]MCZ8511202.1 hypothetical protein [Paenibacillus filicis]
MNLRDALFNWLQIRIVAEARPDDLAAAETRDFFEVILREDHRLKEFQATNDETMYRIRYVLEGTPKLQMFDRESAEQLLSDINSNPKYNE